MKRQRHSPPQTFTYAIDTWGGDEHAGFYNEDVYNKVLRHWEDHHRIRSRLVRSTFDLAAEHFEDKSIDILHIDGLHTYAAVKHDYETWLPKLKDESIVLFHDINVREREFGVWKLWEDINNNNKTHEVLNGHGLGILVFGKKMDRRLEELPSSLRALQAKGEILERIAQLSLDLSSALEAVDQARAEAEQAALSLRCIQESRMWRLTRPARVFLDYSKRIFH